MSTTATPYGLKPIGLVGGRVFAGSVRKLPIASAYGTSIFFGDPVKLNAGNVERDGGTTTATPVGVFMGCSYMDTTFGWVNRQYWPASTTPQSNAQPSATVGPQAFVCDDPHALFAIQADGIVTAAKLGQNATIISTAGSTTTGNSLVTLHASTINTTSTFPLRIVDFVYGPTSAPGDAFTDCIVMWNFGTHLYLNATGTA